MPKTTEQHLIARSDKSVAYVTNYKRLRSIFCTIKANYWQTLSIAWPLCNSRATCRSLLSCLQHANIDKLNDTEALTFADNAEYVVAVHYMLQQCSDQLIWRHYNTWQMIDSHNLWPHTLTGPCRSETCNRHSLRHCLSLSNWILQVTNTSASCSAQLWYGIIQNTGIENVGKRAHDSIMC